VQSATLIVRTSVAGTDARPAYRPLGGLRFALAIMVVMQHFQHLLAPGQRAVFSRAGFGAVAVAMFFVVSGFVVTEANATFYAGRPNAFFVNRLIRLVPPYFAALALSIGVHVALWQAGVLVLWDYPLAGAPFTAGRVGAGIMGLLPGLHLLRPGDPFEFIPFAWSLRVEMAFYAASWATMLLAARMRSPRVTIRLVLVGALAISVIGLGGGQPSIVSCLPMFLAGVGCCLVMRRQGRAAYVFVAAALPMAGLGFASWIQHGHPDLAMQLALLSGLVALFAVLAERPAGGWHKVDRRLGDLSYPLYLNHYVVGIGLTGLCPWRGPAVCVAGVGLSIALAAAMSALVDGRLVAFRNRIRHVAL
jgi:peptidoglycan/LPS O-acetylase OafA/YrhL